jgi:hypothetical protein
MRVLQASSIAAAVEAKLYIRGKGYFGTLQPDGSVLPVRTCLDFMYVPAPFKTSTTTCQIQTGWSPRSERPI